MTPERADQVRHCIAEFFKSDPTCLDSDVKKGAETFWWTVPEVFLESLPTVSEGCTLQEGVLGALADPYLRRCIVDSILLGNDRETWDRCDRPTRERLFKEKMVDIADNRFSKALNKCSFVMKVDERFLTAHIPARERRFEAGMEMLGTLSLLNLGTREVYGFTKDAFRKKYGKDSVGKIFRELYLERSLRRDVFEWAVLVVCDRAKLFSIHDFMTNKELSQDFGEALSLGGQDIRTLFLSIVAVFDKGVDPLFPGSRFRVGQAPGQDIVNRLGASFWLKKTLESIKAGPRPTARPVQERVVEGAVGKTSLLKMAIAQRVSVSMSRSSGPPERGTRAVLSGCTDTSVTLYLPKAGPVPCRAGEVLKGSFCVKMRNTHVTFCEFESAVEQVEGVNDRFVALTLKLPRKVSAFRRATPRVKVENGCVSWLEIQQCHTEKGPDGAFSRTCIAQPVVCLPVQMHHFEMEDISATGMRLNISEEMDNPQWKGLFAGCEMIVRLVLPTQHGKPPFEAVLHAVVKNTTVNANGSTSIGVQFNEVGSARPNGTLTWKPVGERGYWELGDWIFKYGRMWSGHAGASRNH